MNASDKRLLGLALPALVTMLGSVAVPVPASAQASEYCEGFDSPVFDSPGVDGQLPHPPAFQDIVCSTVLEEEGDTLRFHMEVAGPVLPPLPPGAKEVWFYWPLDFDPEARPAGYPLGHGALLPAEFMVVVSWDGTEFTGMTIDRRPLLTGDDAIVLTLDSFWIDGDTVEAVLDASLRQQIPETFRWQSTTRDWDHPPDTSGSNGQHLIDHGADGWSSFPLEND